MRSRLSGLLLTMVPVAMPFTAVRGTAPQVKASPPAVYRKMLGDMATSWPGSARPHE